MHEKSFVTSGPDLGTQLSAYDSGSLRVKG